MRLIPTTYHIHIYIYICICVCNGANTHFKLVKLNILEKSLGAQHSH